MDTNSNLKQLILDGVEKAQTEGVGHLNLYTDDGPVYRENEFLFFLKPELTIASPTIRLDAILDLVFEKIATFGFFIEAVNLIDAGYLDKYNIMAQHYGVINQRATDASNVKNFADDKGKREFYKSFNKQVEDVDFIGGIEFLSKYPFLTSQSLELLWKQFEPQVKLANGTYCRKLQIHGDEAYVINGFHSNQLLHFTDKGRSIVTISLLGDLQWKVARNSFIGLTDPAHQNAQEGSLRKLLLQGKDKFGLPEVSQGQNGFHLSAGPVEGLLELVRFNSDFSNNEKIRHYNEFVFGKKLAKSFTKDVIEDILSNKNVTLGLKTESVFDLTEEVDSDQAIAQLSQVFQQANEAAHT